MPENNIQQLKEEDHPKEAPSLLELSARIVANNAENLLNSRSREVNQNHPAAPIHPQSCCCGQGLLPVHASEKVLEKLCEKWRGRAMNPEELDASLTPFYHGQLCPVANADFSSVPITARILAALLIGQRESLTSLSLINSTKGMPVEILCILLQQSKIKLTNLRSLKLNSLDILRDPRGDCRPYGPPQFVHFCPNLEHLYLLQTHTYNIEEETEREFLVRIFSDLPKLRTLDLSGWALHDDLSPLQTHLQSLTTLVLYNAPDLEHSISTIASLKTLKNLDISQSCRSHGQYAQPVSCLHKLVVSLRELQSLDISGTNLTVMPSDNDRPFRGTTTDTMVDSDIPGLRCLERPLKFLGIFNCEGTSAEWKNIPAEKISSEHSEDQLITAMEMYLDRPRTLRAVIHESFELYRFGSDLHRHVEALHLVLRSLEMHSGNEDVQIRGAASMFFIILIGKVTMNWDTKRRVIQAMIDGMEKQFDSPTMAHNFCSGLIQFDIPHDIQSAAYGRVAKLLTRVLERHGSSDALVQRRVVCLLKAMVDQMGSKRRAEMGNAGAIEVILQQIARKLHAGTCDELMVNGWSFLYRVTHAIPANCERFLSAEGLPLFSQCMAKFGDQNPPELVPTMMGVIARIAVVSQLRARLMTNELLETFCNLLENGNAADIRAFYSSAGVLATLIGDEQAWIKSGITLARDHVNMLIVQTIEKWDLQARLHIQYRSFAQLFHMLSQWHAVGSQHWAVWTLANLTETTTDERKKKQYYRMFTQEGGMELLEQLKTDSRCTHRIRELVCIVMRNVEDWKRQFSG